jgi:hypothetical protein
MDPEDTLPCSQEYAIALNQFNSAHKFTPYLFKIQFNDILRHLGLSSGKKKGKAVPLHAMKAPGGKGGIAPTHSQPRH